MVFVLAERRQNIITHNSADIVMRQLTLSELGTIWTS